MKHGKHLLLMAGCVVLAAILFSTTGKGFAVLLPLAGCGLMMFFMMRGMGGMGASQQPPEGRDEPQDTSLPAPRTMTVTDDPGAALPRPSAVAGTASEVPSPHTPDSRPLA